MPLLGDCHNYHSNSLTIDTVFTNHQDDLGQYKVNEIINTFLVAGDLGHLLKIKEYKKKIKETGDSRHLYQNKLGKWNFNMIWFMVVLKIYVEEQLLKKY